MLHIVIGGTTNHNLDCTDNTCDYTVCSPYNSYAAQKGVQSLPSTVKTVNTALSDWSAFTIGDLVYIISESSFGFIDVNKKINYLQKKAKSYQIWRLILLGLAAFWLFVAWVFS